MYIVRTTSLSICEIQVRIILGFMGSLFVMTKKTQLNACNNLEVTQFQPSNLLSSSTFSVILTEEARIALGYRLVLSTSLVLSNLQSASITRRTHANHQRIMKMTGMQGSVWLILYLASLATSIKPCS